MSAISLAELYFADKKWRLFKSFTEVYQTLLQKPYVAFADFKSEDVLQFDANTAVPEMHDRIIVGLARRLDVSLITSDTVIIASGVVRVES